MNLKDQYCVIVTSVLYLKYQTNIKDNMLIQIQFTEKGGSYDSVTWKQRNRRISRNQESPIQ